MRVGVVGIGVGARRVETGRIGCVSAIKASEGNKTLVFGFGYRELVFAF